LRFTVALQADGSIIRFDDKEVKIDFCVRKRRKYDRLLHLISQIGVSNKELLTPDRYRVYITVPAERVHKYLHPGKRKLWKQGTVFLPGVASVLCDEVYYWDGCFTTKNMYASREKTNADYIQTAHLLLGKRANVRRYVNSIGSISWQVDVTHRNYSGTANLERGEGVSRVACVTVPSTWVLVRRNGKVLISGNTQNWPREEGFREMFQARPGHLLGTVDYSGLELVTLASTILHRYGRSQLADAINGGMDVHCKTAADFYGLDYEVVLKGKKQAPYKNMRQQSKAVNFGAPGGLGPPALSEYARTTYGVTMTIPECKAFLDRFKKQIWPDVGLYLRDQGSENRQYDGKLATAYNNMGRMKANCTYTQACNYPFQSLGADAAKWALWNLTRIRLLSWWHAEFEPGHELARHPLRNSRTVNFVHDEIVMEHPENLAQEAYAEQQRIMVAALGEVARGVKPAVEGALGPNWGH